MAIHYNAFISYYISLVSLEDKRLLSGYLEMSIDSSHQPLRCGFLITSRTIDLTSKIKILYILKFESRLQLSRIEIIIFHSIGRPENLGILKTFNTMQGIHLNIKRQ